MSDLTLATFEEFETDDFRVLYLENVPQNIVYFQGPLPQKNRIAHPQIPGLYYSPTIVLLSDGTFTVENSSDDKVIQANPGMLSVWRTPGRYKFISTSETNTCICLTPKKNTIHYRDSIYFDNTKDMEYNFNSGWIISNVNFELDGIYHKKFELITVSGTNVVKPETSGWFLHVWQ
jgi:hypothetical protein